MNAIGGDSYYVLHGFQSLKIDKPQGEMAASGVNSFPLPQRLEDRVSIGQKTPETATYGMALKGIGEQGHLSRLRSHVMDTLSKQGRMVRLAGDDGTSEVRKVTNEEAQELIDFDGYYGVEQSSSRIAQSAISTLSESPEKFDRVMVTIYDGFSDAETALDGVLLEINYRTLDSIQAKVTEWMGGFLPPEG